MSFLRLIPTRRLVLLFASVVAALGAVTAIALAAGGNGSEPPPKPLATALHDAAAAPAVAGVTAKISFRNKLIDAASLTGTDPILGGATGRLWATKDALRLELQSTAGGGDAEVVVDQQRFWIYVPAANTVYQGTIAQDQSATDQSDNGGAVPSVSRIQSLLDRFAANATLSGATPSNVAGRPAYTVRVTPKHDGGLLGGAELAWDAANGVPLRAAIYAAGRTDPVLELKATDIAFGPVAASDLQASPPPGAKVVDLGTVGGPETGAGHGAAGDPSVEGLDAVQAKVPFKLSAPDTLAGLPRAGVRLIKVGDQPAALVTYGHSLAGVAVLESATPQDAGAGAAGGGDHGGLSLPKVSINGVSGEELDTALGSVVRFSRGGVDYTVIGSVPPVAAEAAARGL